MLAKVQKWGNSQGVRIPKILLEESHFSVGDQVDIVAQEGKIIMKPIDKVHGKYDIRAL